MKKTAPPDSHITYAQTHMSTIKGVKWQNLNPEGLSLSCVLFNGGKSTGHMRKVLIRT